VLLRRYRLNRALDALRNCTRNAIPARLISSPETPFITTPLWFELPVTRVVKSAAEKKLEAIAAIAAKEGSFRLPSQYVDSVTAFIPELMNFMLSRRIKNKKLTYKVAKHAIRNIY
jgi:hypothetical protein